MVVGIAGGVPDLAVSGEHVRPGDIVVSDQYGAIRYERVTKTRQNMVSQPFPDPPGAHLFLVIRNLPTEAFQGRGITRGILKEEPARREICAARLPRSLSTQRRGTAPRVV
jgi:hypothetical protein